ncbi:complement factor I [Discoglossus pictus]
MKTLWIISVLLCPCFISTLPKAPVEENVEDPQAKCLEKKFTSNSCLKVFCAPWQRCVDGRCVCKLPYQCPKNGTLNVCTEGGKMYKNYCHLKSAECSNPIHRFSSDLPCGTFEISLTHKKSDSKGIVNVKLPKSDSPSLLCGRGWTISEANVACKQLKFPKGASLLFRTEDFNVPEEGLEDSPCLEVKCKGLENSLAECSIKNSNHNGRQPAGVVCYTETRECDKDEFSCVNGKCISATRACNGANDCGDLSDELCCSKCKNSFHCKSDTCIPLEYKCNNELDCITGDDEFNCTGGSGNSGKIGKRATVHLINSFRKCPLALSLGFYEILCISIISLGSGQPSEGYYSLAVPPSLQAHVEAEKSLTWTGLQGECLPHLHSPPPPISTYQTAEPRGRSLRPPAQTAHTSIKPSARSSKAVPILHHTGGSGGKPSPPETAATALSPLERKFCYNVKKCIMAYLHFHLTKCSFSHTEQNNAVPYDMDSERKLLRDSLPRLHCGVVKRAARQKRIIGGVKAVKNQFPWQVAVKDGSQVNCGGIYIGGCWVLTAAHCVRDNQPQKYRVIVELLDRLAYDGDIDSFPVKSVKVHESYNPKTYENDIALLEVVNIYQSDKCMQVDNNLVPACMPWSSYQFKAGETCVVSGWGRAEGLSKVFHLMWGHINLMDNCSSVYKERFLDKMECAGTYDGSIDACKGDSGGPLVCYDVNNVAYLWGIVSWGDNCGLAGYPGVYTKVSEYFEWISRKVGRQLIAQYNV